MQLNFLLTNSVKNLINIFLSLFVLCTIAACTSSRSVDKSALEIPDFNKDQIWQLTAMRGKPVDTQGKTFTLQFNPETGDIHGFMACNKYFGHYNCHPGDPQTGLYPIEIGLDGSGSLGCPEADMNADSRYYALLPKATHLSYTSTSLTLYQNNKEILRYELQ